MPFAEGSNWTDEEFHATLDKVLSRSQTDLKFRSLALSDSNAAIKEIASKPLPEGRIVNFVDNDGLVKTIPLP